MSRIDDGKLCVSRILNRMSLCDIIWIVALIPTVIVFAIVLWSQSSPPSETKQYNSLLAVAHWFDPVFFQYNLIMAALAILTVPFLALSYSISRIDSKERRLLHEIKETCEDEKAREELEANVRRRIGSRASFGAYGGSLLLTMLVVSLGVGILLLFKPAYSPGEPGVHFDLGANMLMMGPFIELFGKDMTAYYSHLTHSLTAFQFGFLGAYIYFIGSLARAYFTLDLTPHTFVDGSIRMIVASVLALLLSFAPVFSPAPLQPATLAVPAESAQPVAASAVPQSAPAQSAETGNDASESGSSLGWLPIVSFFFGFYPKQALAFMRNIVTRKLGHKYSYRELPLSSLAGISYAHETRLEREGFDNIENLSHADAVDLAIRTSFGYKQLAQWIDEAWLASHLREDYAEFVKRTSITCRKELKLFFDGCGSIAQAAEQLKMTGSSTSAEPGVPWEGKLAALNVLLESNAPATQNG